MKGRFFVIEGLDGAGKATQIRLLAKKLRAQGAKVTVFTFPNYEGLVGRFIGEALCGKHGDLRAMDPYFRAFPFAIDRLNMRSNILAALQKGFVLCDRYTPSNLAFNAASCPPKSRAAFRKFFSKLEYDIFKLPRPDMIVYLKIPLAISRDRLQRERRGDLDSNERDAAYQKAVAMQYEELAKGKEWRTVVCEAGESPEAISRMVEEALRR